MNDQTRKQIRELAALVQILKSSLSGHFVTLSGLADQEQNQAAVLLNEAAGDLEEALAAMSSCIINLDAIKQYENR